MYYGHFVSFGFCIPGLAHAPGAAFWIYKFRIWSFRALEYPIYWETYCLGILKPSRAACKHLFVIPLSFSPKLKDMEDCNSISKGCSTIKHQTTNIACYVQELLKTVRHYIIISTKLDIHGIISCSISYETAYGRDMLLGKPTARIRKIVSIYYCARHMCAVGTTVLPLPTLCN